VKEHHLPVCLPAWHGKSQSGLHLCSRCEIVLDSNVWPWRPGTACEEGEMEALRKWWSAELWKGREKEIETKELTNSMERSPYRVHKNPSLTAVLSQINPVHSFASYIFKICFNIILPSMLCALKLTREFKVSGQIVLQWLVSPMCAACPTHLIHLVWWP
jgi:hypothetical protein